MKIQLFTTATCNPCKKVKEYLTSETFQGIGVEVIDVKQQPEYIEKYKIQSVPLVVVLDDEDIEVVTLHGVDNILNKLEIYI